MSVNFDTIRDDVKIILRQTLKSKHSTKDLEQKHKSFQKTDRDLKASFDQAFRDVLLELIQKETNVLLLQDLVTLSIESCRKDLLPLSNPVALLSDIFDLLTLEHCDVMFHYVEEHVNVWKEDLFFSSCKNILLRMCNDLLRRLSKSNATIFCGRILLFLAKFFPFSERSGLNIVSEFNLENITEYRADQQTEELKDDNGKEGQKGKLFIDYSLYCKFWSLQDFFRNPNQCYDKVQWKLFCSHAANIVSTFQGLKLEHLESVDKDSPWNISMNTFKEKDIYFSKYLTNQKLLDLQLYDVNFRRFVLLQFLVLFQYLTTTVRFKTSYELNSDQKNFIQNTSEKVHALLRETPPDGVNFDAIVANILVREEHWNAWKNDGCPEFRKALPASASDSATTVRRAPKRPLLGDVMKEARSKGAYHMGNTELTKLWNLYPDNLEACKAKERDFLPSLETYFSDAIDALIKDDPEQEMLLKDGNFGWRALRLLARRSPHFFTHSNKPISELHKYLDVMVHRIASEKNAVASHDAEEGEGNDDDDLFKQSEEATEVDGEFQLQNIVMFRVTVLTISQFHSICTALESHWQSLARKLGYKNDEIEYIASHNVEKIAQVTSLLHLWFEEDDDSTLDNFLYILEGLDLTEAADEVKLAIEQNKNLTTDTSNNEND